MPPRPNQHDLMQRRRFPGRRTDVRIRMSAKRPGESDRSWCRPVESRRCRVRYGAMARQPSLRQPVHSWKAQPSGGPVGSSTSVASDAPTGRPAAPAPPPGTPARHPTVVSAGQGGTRRKGSRDHRSPRTVRSRGYPGLASQPAMDALLLLRRQSDTPPVISRVAEPLQDQDEKGSVIKP
jgi:hypothetical protein